MLPFTAYIVILGTLEQLLDEQSAYEAVQFPLSKGLNLLEAVALYLSSQHSTGSLTTLIDAPSGAPRQ